MREHEPIGVDETPLDDLALEALAEAHATRPPAALRAAILTAVRADAQASAVARSRTRWRAVGSIAAVLALVLGGLLARGAQRLTATGAQLSALSRDFAALEGQLAAERTRLVSLQETVDAQAQFLR